MSGRVLVVDDEPGLRFFQRMVLEERGLDVHEAYDGSSALKRCAEDAFNAIVLDYRMPGLTGLDVARELRGRGDDTPIVIYTGYLDPAVAQAAGELGLQTIDKTETEQLLDAVCGLAA